MREAYLTGGGEHFDATDAPATDANPAPLEPSQMWAFSSVALTDDFNLTLAGCRMGSDASDDFTITRHCKPHPDMLKALRRLTLHMCLLTEELKPQMDDAQRDLTAELVAFMGGKYGEGGQQLELFGRDPDPVSATTRNLVGVVEEFLDKIDAAAERGGYTVSVGTPGGEMKEITGKKRKARRTGEKKGGQPHD